MKTILQYITIITLCTSVMNAQSSGDFRSKTTGNWADATSWETFNGSIWGDAGAAPTISDGVITIQNGHNITIATSASTDQLIVNSGGILTISASQTLTVADGTGSDLTVNGNIFNSGVITLSSGVVVDFNSGSYYTHAANDAAIPKSVSASSITVNWNSNSTVEITGWTSVTSKSGAFTSTPATTWGNIILNFGGAFGSNINFAGNLKEIAGNLNIKNLGTTTVRFTASAPTNVTVNIGGNLIIEQGIFQFAGGTSATNCVLNIGGNFTMTGGTFHGNSGSSSIIPINLTGSNKTYTHSAGTLTQTSWNWTVKSGASYTLNNNITLATSREFVVENNAVLNCGANIIAGPTFILNSGGTLGIGSATGITSSGATGNVQTTTRTFNTTANYLYNGSLAQETGSGLPASVNNLTINNSSGVFNSQVLTVNGVLTLSTGVFNNTTNAVTLGGGGSIVYAGGSFDSPVPVELVSFRASSKGKSIQLHWNTATEVNNAGFEVERTGVSGQRSAASWSKVGYVEGNGTTNSPKEYRFVDVPKAGAVYQYRLKQIDRDGKFEYSPVVEATVALTSQDYSLSQNYPNPFNPGTSFSFAVKNAEQTTVKVYNLIGEEVATLFNQVAQPNQLYTMKFDGKDLASGIYFYSLRSASRNEVKKMSLIK